MGTSRYEHLEPLPAVANNLQALADLLEGPLSLHLPARHVTVMENPAAAPTVVGAVRQAAAEATDTLVVYFAGHGLVDAQDQLCPALLQTEFGRNETGLPYDWVRQVLLQDSRAERHVVILDCCYSGRALGRMSAGTGLADHAAVEGSFLLAAAAETRTALAPVGETYTAFTGALLETLRQGIPGGPPLLDLGEIYRHLRWTLDAGSPGPSHSAGAKPQQRCSGRARTQPRRPPRHARYRCDEGRCRGASVARSTCDPHRGGIVHCPRGCTGGQWPDPPSGQPALGRAHRSRHRRPSAQPQHPPCHLDHDGCLPFRLRCSRRADHAVAGRPATTACTTRVSGCAGPDASP
ncbi:caspase family protein [Streptomyces canus]